MIIKSIMTDEDRKALEYMLSLEYAMPYQLLKTKNSLQIKSQAEINEL